ncbi:MAG: hypothetical protein KDD34_03155 [Bdellovibrionales bacterium]|nr:hypothetical protein [Bdellovibrionales bacterium]
MSEIEAWFLSKILVVTVAILGLGVYSNLVSPPHDSLEVNTQRAPASLVNITEINKEVVFSKSLVSTLDLHCVDETRKIELKSQSKQLRFIGKLCHLIQPGSELFLTNTSNGFEASIFSISENSFSTDYVYLKDGVNRIVIRQLDPTHEDAMIVTELNIERQDKFVLDGTSNFNSSTDSK